MAHKAMCVLLIALMCPTLVVSLSNKMFKVAINEAEPITGLIIIEATGGKVDCRSLGAAWSLAGPSLMMSPLTHRNSTVAVQTGLCIERDHEAQSVITGISFAVVQTEGVEAVNSLLSKVVSVSLSSANATKDVGVTKDPEEHCASLGASWALIQGHVAPVATSKMVHVCVQSAPRSQAGVEESITNIAPYTLGTAWQTSCASLTASSKFARVMVPAMDVEAFYENPLLLCVERRNQVQSSASQNTTPASAFGDGMHGDFPLDMFPKVDFDVGVDSGNRSRNHIFVVGPETSGTRLWSQIMRDSTGLASNEGQDTQWVYDNKAAVFHLSLPWGSECGATPNVPDYMNFGGTAEAYKLVIPQTANIQTAFHAPRFNVQPLNIVRNHRSRGDVATVLLIARDPRASLAGKMHDHCRDNEVGVAEQTEAYKLLLDAYRANDPNIHVICYEEMLSRGTEYIREKFIEMNMVPGPLPEIINANSKYSLDDFECEGDMLTYGELCPNTELGKSIQGTCAQEARR